VVADRESIVEEGRNKSPFAAVVVEPAEA
jgi:hypothetical protein